MHILAWTNHSCIEMHTLLVLDGSLYNVQYVQYVTIRQIILLFSMIWYCRIQSPSVSKQQDVQWCCFSWSIPMSIQLLIGLIRLLHDHIVYEIDTGKIIAAFFEFSIVCMIWYAWIQSSAMFKQQDVRWWGFRWSIPPSFDYVLNSFIDRAIRT